MLVKWCKLGYEQCTWEVGSSRSWCCHSAQPALYHGCCDLGAYSRCQISLEHAVSVADGTACVLCLIAHCSAALQSENEAVMMQPEHMHLYLELWERQKRAMHKAGMQAAEDAEHMQQQVAQQVRGQQAPSCRACSQHECGPSCVSWS